MSVLRGRLEAHPLVLWSDSACAEEVAAAIVSGARGATTNPPLVLKVVRSDARWSQRAICSEQVQGLS